MYLIGGYPGAKFLVRVDHKSITLEMEDIELGFTTHFKVNSLKKTARKEKKIKTERKEKQNEQAMKDAESKQKQRERAEK